MSFETKNLKIEFSNACQELKRMQHLLFCRKMYSIFALKFIVDFHTDHRV